MDWRAARTPAVKVLHVSPDANPKIAEMRNLGSAMEAALLAQLDVLEATQK